MSSILLLSIPSHGHMNPTLGLAAALSAKGEHVTFFSSEEFRGAVENTGAHFMKYTHDLNIFGGKPPQPTAGDAPKPRFGFVSVLMQPEKFIDDVMEQIKGKHFDYMICSAAYPYGSVIAQLLNIPLISSYAVFATMKDFQKKNNSDSKMPKAMPDEANEAFNTFRESFIEKYKVEIPSKMMELFYNKGALNIIYTSKYFIPDPSQYDDSFIFIGPPVFQKKYNVDFPFEKLEGKKVIYISMGTVFSGFSNDLNKLFFEAFADADAVVVMAAHKLDTSAYQVPSNFIIRDFVPQLELLKYTSAAITHAGMNSIGDLLYHKVPFVSIPLGADQFFLSNRAQELGATIVLDANTVTTAQLRDAVEKVQNDPSYRDNLKKISDSFIAAGGYDKAVEEIFELKKKKGITN